MVFDKSVKILIPVLRSHPSDHELVEAAMHLRPLVIETCIATGNGRACLAQVHISVLLSVRAIGVLIC